jgi:hypothetical protein
LETIEYVGDLDHEGMQRATAGIRAAIAAGLPAIAPAAVMHRAMLACAERFGHPLYWHCRSFRRKLDWDVVHFLPLELRTSVRAVIESGRRIPEEVLGPDELAPVWTG